MSKITLNLRGLSTLELVSHVRQVVKAMTGNPHFPTPQPPLTALTTAANELETANSDVQASRQQTATLVSIKDSKQVALVTLLRQSAGYIESVGGDDESKILSAGMSVRAAATPGQPPAAPGDLTATEGDHDGEIDLHWRPSKGSTYEIQRSLDPPTPASWAHVAIASKSSATIGGLTSGTRYWFRVAAVNSAGQSGWSDPATKIAP